MTRSSFRVIGAGPRVMSGKVIILHIATILYQNCTSTHIFNAGGRTKVNTVTCIMSLAVIDLSIRAIFDNNIIVAISGKGGI